MLSNRMQKAMISSSVCSNRCPIVLYSKKRPQQFNFKLSLATVHNSLTKILQFKVMCTSLANHIRVIRDFVLLMLLFVGFCFFFLHCCVLNAYFLLFRKLSSFKIGIFSLMQNICSFPSDWPPRLSYMIKRDCLFSYLGSQQTNFRAGDRRLNSN